MSFEIEIHSRIWRAIVSLSSWVKSFSAIFFSFLWEAESVIKKAELLSSHWRDWRSAACPPLICNVHWADSMLKTTQPGCFNFYLQTIKKENIYLLYYPFTCPEQRASSQFNCFMLWGLYLSFVLVNILWLCGGKTAKGTCRDIMLQSQFCWPTSFYFLLFVLVTLFCWLLYVSHIKHNIIKHKDYIYTNLKSQNILHIVVFSEPLLRSSVSQEEKKNKQKFMQIWRIICELIFSPMGPPLPCEIHNPSL